MMRAAKRCQDQRQAHQADLSMNSEQNMPVGQALKLKG